MRYPKTKAIFSRYLNIVTSVIAILLNVLILIRVTLLIINMPNHVENMGIISLPFTILLHSLIVFSFLGFINLNRIKSSRKYLTLGATISSIATMVGYVFIPIPHLIIGGVLFFAILILLIKYVKNLNLLPLLMNMIVIVTGLYFLDFGI